MRLIEELNAHSEAGKQKAAADYAALVNQAARDEKIDVAKATKILEAAGKTPADLEAVVGAKRRRLALLEKLTTIPGEIEAERNELMAVVEAADKTLSDAAVVYGNAMANHRAAVGPFVNRLREIANYTNEMEAIHAQLRATYPADGPLRQEAAAASTEVLRTSEAIERAAAAVVRTRSALRQAREQLTIRQSYRDDACAAACVALEGKAAVLAVELADHEERLLMAQTASRAANEAAAEIDRRMGCE